MNSTNFNSSCNMALRHRLRHMSSPHFLFTRNNLEVPQVTPEPYQHLRLLDLAFRSRITTLMGINMSTYTRIHNEMTFMGRRAVVATYR